MSPIYLKHGDDFVAMSEQPYQAEDILQVLLAEHPELLAGDADSADWVLVRREAGIADADDAPDRWSLDHLFLDAAGVPTLVEAKRSSDPRARREVVAQMLDYAANSTAFWTVDRLQAWFEAECGHRGTDSEAALQAAFGVSDPDAYWSRVQTNLAADRIRLVFVADEIAPELARIVEYLNGQMRETEVVAVEVKQYVDATGARQTLVPRIIGRTEAARVAKGAHGQAHAPLDLSSAPAAFHELIGHMDQVAAELGLTVTTGRTGRNYRPASPEQGVSYTSGVGVYATGSRAEFNLEVFRTCGRDDLAEDLLHRISAVTGQSVTARSWPATPCEAAVQDWPRIRRELIEPYFRAREALRSPAADSG